MQNGSDEESTDVSEEIQSPDSSEETSWPALVLHLYGFRSDWEFYVTYLSDDRYRVQGKDSRRRMKMTFLSRRAACEFLFVVLADCPSSEFYIFESQCDSVQDLDGQRKRSTALCPKKTATNFDDLMQRLMILRDARGSEITTFSCEEFP